MGDATKLTPTSVVLAGIVEPSLAPAGEFGNYFANSGRCFIHVKNVSGQGTKSVTIVSQTECRYGGTHDVDLADIADGVEMLAGPFPKNRFNDSDGNVQITYGGEAGADYSDITIAVIKVP